MNRFNGRCNLIANDINIIHYLMNVDDSFILFEVVNKNELIKGVRYFIRDYFRKIEYTEIYATFITYIDDWTPTSLAYFRAHEYYSFYQPLNQTIIYRCISKEEYYTKVKEKYDAKCLNIILKGLIDESFQW